jgi:D-glucosaminate-6-phosphate ammonia-lyase
MPEEATMRRSTTTGVCLATILGTAVLAGQTRSAGGSGDVVTGTPRSVYADFGVRTIINVAGSATRVGGAQMPPEVLRAMADAAQESVSMMELQAAASRRIAAATGAEAGYVTSGASAGLTLGTAAILAGLDLARMERLPDTTGMKNEFIISREHRNGYDHAIRVAGAKLVEVGMNEQLAGAGVRRTEAWEFEAAITERTAGIAYVFTGNSQPPLEQVVAVARKHGLPVLVDAAGQLPAGLRRLIASGAALVSSSGGKGLKGPQSTGILCGRTEYIASVALQSLDMDEYFEIWDPPEDLIPKSRLPGLPRHGIGRGFKVGKEEVIGLLMALKLSEGATSEAEADADAARRHLESIVSGLEGLPVESRLILPRDKTGMPSLQLVLNRQALGRSGFDIARELKRGDPGVFVNERLLEQETLVINPMHLDRARTDALTRRLRAVLVSAAK